MEDTHKWKHLHRWSSNVKVKKLKHLRPFSLSKKNRQIVAHLATLWCVRKLDKEIIFLPRKCSTDAQAQRGAGKDLEQHIKKSNIKKSNIKKGTPDSISNAKGSLAHWDDYLGVILLLHVVFGGSTQWAGCKVRRWHLGACSHCCSPWIPFVKSCFLASRLTLSVSPTLHGQSH